MSEKKKPAKFVVEVTAQGYSQTLLDDDGNILHQTIHKLVRAGYATRESGDWAVESEVFANNDWDQLGEAIDDFDGPFDVAGALWHLNPPNEPEDE